MALQTSSRRMTGIALTAFMFSTSMACRQALIAPGVNLAAIRQVNIGMNSQQVVAVLGQPLRTRVMNENGVIYDYAVPGLGVTNVGLWIYFENGAVKEVSAKRYNWITDDKAIYDLRANRPIFETADFEHLFIR